MKFNIKYMNIKRLKHQIKISKYKVIRFKLASLLLLEEVRNQLRLLKEEEKQVLKSISLKCFNLLCENILELSQLCMVILVFYYLKHKIK